MINSLKAMIIVLWSQLGFLVIQVLPLKVAFTVEFLVDNMLPDVVTAKPSCDRRRRLAVRIDHPSRPLTVLITQAAESSRIEASPHQASSPGLASSGLSLRCTERSTGWPHL
jgi:hypothetical protein